jgi:GMP synthase (glutamine-hydrolysing)
MRILAVLHPGAGLTGLVGERAARGGHDVVEWTPADGEHLPGRLASFDAAVVFGGGMNVRDAGRLPWLHGEIELLRDALDARLPVLGVCLGAQLVAAAAGAEVRRARTPEIGWFEVELTAAGTRDPVLGRLPERFRAYEWHSYAFDLPAGAVELARSAVCPQAFRLGDAAWAVQFHPEVTPEIVREWALDYESDPDAVRLGLEPAAHLGLAEQRLPEWMALGRRLFDGFLEAATRPAAAEPEAPPAAAAAAPGPRPRPG